MNLLKLKINSGAAVANLLAETLTLSAGASNVFAYTFATPNATKTPNTSRTNIRNFVFNDDFVPQVPLANWGYGKHGITYTKTAGTLYTNNPSTFKSAVDTFMSDSGRGNANFNLSDTTFLLSHVYSKCDTVQKYYNTVHYANILDSNAYYNSIYGFMRSHVAPAAMGDMAQGAYLLTLIANGGPAFAPIAAYFVKGSNVFFFGVDYIYTAHCPFTYYTAVKCGLFT